MSTAYTNPLLSDVQLDSRCSLSCKRLGRLKINILLKYPKFSLHLFANVRNEFQNISQSEVFNRTYFVLFYRFASIYNDIYHPEDMITAPCLGLLAALRYLVARNCRLNLLKGPRLTLAVLLMFL